jgi:protein MpaA
MNAPEYMATHRAHDYDALIGRWRVLAERCGLELRVYAQLDGYDLFYLETKVADGGGYVSAGMHGDEPAPLWALLEWAEENLPNRLDEPFLIFPCLNPWGVVNNVRCDARGRDMNRLFYDSGADGIGEWLRIVGDRRFRLCLNLHEDYDGQGMYAYELSHQGRMAEELLAAAGAVIAPDPNLDIDGSSAVNGVIRRKVTVEDFAEMGLPEAVYLHLHNADATLTIESPSEFALYDRVRALKLALGAAFGE